MLDVFSYLISNMTFLTIGAWLGVIVTILFIIMFARKRNRDERGWKIFGKASFISFVWLIVIGNVIAKLSGYYPIDQFGFVQFANAVQWIYTSTILIELVSVVVIRKFE